MNWGKGILLVLIAFVGLMAWFLVMAARNPEPLVTESYYKQELAYQSRIDETTRALALTAPVGIVVQDHRIALRFPEELRGTTITGVLTLRRPNDPTADRTVTIDHVVDAAFSTAPLDLRRGRYDALLSWAASGTQYYTEEKLVVP
ncbi:MAG: FixH family protein [Flavobacteriales bacterium]|nr:FixH family protein [Flavobacteriales bacterium]